jgi:N-acetylmuramoyl-L-alanine amidase
LDVARLKGVEALKCVVGVSGCIGRTGRLGEPSLPVRKRAKFIGRTLVFLGAILLASSQLKAAETAPRVAPSRPAVSVPSMATPTPAPVKPLKWTTIAGAEYLSDEQVAEFLGLKRAWIETNHKLSLSDRGTQVQIERDRIETIINGLGVRLGNPIVFREGRLYISRIDFERALLPRVRPALNGPPSPRPKVVVLDAGHGGKDNGMENKDLGLKEKILALDVVLRLQKLFEAAGYKVVLTRAGDTAPIYKELPLRAKLANDAHADVFVSIHFNSLYPDTKTNGTESFIYTPQFQRSTSSWAANQPDDSRKDRVPVNQWDRWSATLLDCVQRQLIGRLKTTDRGQKTKHLLVLQDLNCPAVLIESLFLSNSSEGRKAATPEFRQEIAAAIFAGVRDYFSTVDALRPPEVKIPATPVPSLSSGRLSSP